MSFSVAFFHMGKFESFKDGFLRYNEGEEHVFHELDLDRCSYFEALSILKEEFKYDEAMKLWWKPKRGRMDRDLRPFVSDNDALQLCACAERKKERKKRVDVKRGLMWCWLVLNVDMVGKGDARVEKEDIGEKDVVANKGDARLEDEATIKDVGVADLEDAKVEDEGRDAENEDVAGVDEQSDVDDSGVEELDESEEAMLFWEFFNSKWGPLVIFITTCHDIEPL
ncbi:hypothetical protein DEO72_LG6g378 [Vigna unguiculata]|uniref:PB1-like domain-containing protein n=1 Tax=Vigna unguiculata TaxID=3917 RepID=A0A4D6M4J4_VIGUN|nr:hypothetical protein DEO72_LG6g378 [Vigna unguiculata]